MFQFVTDHEPLLKPSSAFAVGRGMCAGTRSQRPGNRDRRASSNRIPDYLIICDDVARTGNSDFTCQGTTARMDEGIVLKRPLCVLLLRVGGRPD